jgi:hypothetical protein
MTTATRNARISIEILDGDGPPVRLRLNTSSGETWVDLSLSDVLTLRDTFGEVYVRIRGELP